MLIKHIIILQLLFTALEMLHEEGYAFNCLLDFLEF